jgi:nicotinate phosphoribosyltransferase
MVSDTLALQHEALPGEPLLAPVMRDGVLLRPLPALADIRACAAAQIAAMPAELRYLTPAAPYPVAVSEALRELARQIDAGLWPGVALSDADLE